MQLHVIAVGRVRDAAMRAAWAAASVAGTSWSRMAASAVTMIVAAISGSTTRELACTRLKVARASVREWPMVNAVTSTAMCFHSR